MWLPLLGLLIGFVIVYMLKIPFPMGYASYLSVGILAGLDTVLGGLRAGMEEKFDRDIFISGFFANITVAILLTYFGDLIGVEMLYLAAVVAFGVRIFNNISLIRRHLIERAKSE